MIKAIIVLSSLLVAIFSYSEALIHPSPKYSNLRLANYTGLSITPSMVTYFIKTINEAYTYYLEDL